MMKQATYTRHDGSQVVVDYDETAPCRICGLPVGAASVGGTDVCPACDCGRYRDGTQIPFADVMRPERLRARARYIEGHAAP